MTITEYLISTCPIWAEILTDGDYTPVVQLELFKTTEE